MRIKTTYIADDGTEFNNYKSCEYYEAKTNNAIDLLNETIHFYNYKGERIFPNKDFTQCPFYIKIASTDLIQVKEILNDLFPDYTFTKMVQKEPNCLTNKLWIYDENLDKWVPLQNHINELEKIYYNLLFSVI